MLNWLKKFWHAVFGDEYEESISQRSRPLGYGRIASNERKGVAKIRHEYPKQGNFRFPLIPDEEGDVKKELTFQRDKKDRLPYENPPRRAKEYFTGQDFKAADIPSPVYGFRERSIHRESEQKQETIVPEPPNIEPIVNDSVRIDLDEYDHATNKQEIDIEQEKEIEIFDQVDDKEQADDEEIEQELEKPDHSSLISMNQPIKEEKQMMAVMPPSTNEREGYQLPTLELLDQFERKQSEDSNWLVEQRQLLEKTLKNFKVNAVVTDATSGPSITRFEVQPSPGVKVNKITNLSDDIKLNLAAKEIRIEAPIPGRNAIGIEVPNRSSHPVGIREVIESRYFQNHSSPLAAALGVDISGKPVVTDLRKMPHGLIAGATGSGKSVCINSILVSLLFKAHPDDVKLLLIDPKVVELAPYNDVPHLVTPVVTDVKEATSALKWAVEEMETRYKKFANTKVRDIERYNETMTAEGKTDEKMAYVVIVIDELADLMMVSPQEVEDAICRIAQKARACGIHLLVATQRPSVDVITGLIKANIPTRIAFAVSSQVDSRTILDSGGADKLLGKGDMLFLENGSAKPVRLQGNFVSDDEIERITTQVKEQQQPQYFIEREELVTFSGDELEDDLFSEACEFVFQQGAASSSSLQRRFRIGYNRAARLIDMMEEAGLISQANGSKPRKILQTKKEFYEKSI